ncbi:MAG: hypothetical protein OEZ19_04640 [Paracoccaceae bacterium]|nr:hypothetical protein [Paracoccaceae bacterium]
MEAVWIHAAIAVWWSFAAVFFVVSMKGHDSPSECLALAIFWPVFAMLYVVVMLIKIPFRTAREIRAALRARNLLREFEAWLRDREAEKEGKSYEP